MARNLLQILLVLVALHLSHSFTRAEADPKPPGFRILDPSDFEDVIKKVSVPFYKGPTPDSPGIPPDAHYEWARINTPFFDCSDSDVLETFYFRWYSYNNHIRTVDEAANHTTRVVTEFYPTVPWAHPKYNTIPCAAGHHVREGRWLRDDSIISEYLNFWLLGDGRSSIDTYTFWVADSVLQYLQVTGNVTEAATWFPHLVEHYYQFKQRHYSHEFGCFFQEATREGEENSVGGDGCRPFTSSVMFGEASALQQIAQLLSNETAASTFRREKKWCRSLVLDTLWSTERNFFVTLAAPDPALNNIPIRQREDAASRATQLHHPQSTSSPGANCTAKGQPSWPRGELVDVRELAGLSSPWYFQVPDPEDVDATRLYAQSWHSIFDRESGFAADWGLRTAEISAQCYNFTQFVPVEKRHECNWNGPSWPYETSKIISAAGEVIKHYPESVVAESGLNDERVMSLISQFARQHTRGAADEGVSPWVGETIHPDSGVWLARRIMFIQGREDRYRGIWYNHSTFNDIIVTVLAGITMSHDMRSFRLRPLKSVDYFALDNLKLQGHNISISFDATGVKYRKGIEVWVNDRSFLFDANDMRIEVALED